MASAGVGAAAGAGAGGDDGRDDQNVRRFFEASYDNLNKLNHPAPENCPRCNSKDFKFAYYNNGQLSQPRYICKTCERGWTHGGVLHDIPVGGHKRKRTPATRPEVVPTVVPATEIPSNSREQEQVMAPPMPPMPMPVPMPMPMPMPDVSQLIEAGLSMMRTLAMPNQMIPPPMLPNPVMTYHQEVPSFYPLMTTTAGWSSMVESSVNNPAGWNLDDIVHPPPPPPPQPQPQAQQQPEVVTLNHGEIDDDDDFNTIMEWSIEDLLASDDEF